MSKVWIKLCSSNGTTLKRLMSSTVEGRILYDIRNIAGRIFSFRLSDYWYHLLDKITQNRKTNKTAIALGRVHYFGEIIDRDAWYPFKRIEFEDTYINVPNKPHIYLKKLYGDSYMQQPLEKDRESHFIKRIKVLDEIK